MRKFAIATMLVLAAATAGAVELGVTTTHQYGNQEGNGFGVTLGQKYGKAGVTAGFTRSTLPSATQDRYSVEGSYDVASFKGATVAATAGVAYLDNGAIESGSAATVGASVSYPLTKSIAATAAYRYQAGDTRVRQFDGSQVTAGVKYSF